MRVITCFCHCDPLSTEYMHSAAFINLQRFFNIYLNKFSNPEIIDFGGASIAKKKTALDVLQKYENIDFKYKSVDINKGSNVDIVLANPYSFSEIKPESVDIVISTSTFEHVEFFWLSFLEILKILKPNGLFYLNAPSNGDFHRFEKDCWRYYPDSANALVKWGKYNKFSPLLLENYTSKQLIEGGWNDYVAVFLKDEKFINNFKERIIYNYKDYFNGIDHEGKLYNFSNKTEDHKNWGFKLWYKIRKKIDKKKIKIDF